MRIRRSIHPDPGHCRVNWVAHRAKHTILFQTPHYITKAAHRTTWYARNSVTNYLVAQHYTDEAITRILDRIYGPPSPVIATAPVTAQTIPA